MVSKRSSRKAESQEFYILDPSYATRYYWAEVDAESLKGREFHRDFVDFVGTVGLNVVSGALSSDFIWNGYLLLIASRRVLETLTSNSVTGWSEYRVRVRRNGELVAGYHGLAIAGRGGPNDPSASADGCIPGTTIMRVKGLFPTQWDGSDLFTLDDVPGAALATSRVKQLFEREKIKNCKFRPASEYSIGY